MHPVRMTREKSFRTERVYCTETRLPASIFYEAASLGERLRLDVNADQRTT